MENSLRLVRLCESIFLRALRVSVVYKVFLSVSSGYWGIYMSHKSKRIRKEKPAPIKLSVVDEESLSEQVNEIESAELSSEQQREYLDLLLRGASPAAACQQLNLNLFLVVELLADDDEFRMKTDAVYDALSQNVAARLYQEAMKGSVPAMSQWLKNRPPPEWPDHAAASISNSPLEVISDEELIRLARLENLTIPTELEADAPETGGSQTPEVIP